MEKAEVGLSVELKVHSTDEINKLFEPGEVGCVLDWVVTNPDGSIASQGIKKAESFTRQFFDLLLQKFKGLTSPGNFTPVTDITNAVRYVTNSSYMFNANAVSGTVTNGIIVGLGNTAAQITDYVMQTPCAHDSGAHGANTFQYGAVSFGAPASDLTTSQFTITRNFANATAGTITVNEIGLYVIALFSPETGAGALEFYSGDTVRNSVGNFMTLHDIIAGGINVLAGQTLTVNYRPQCVI
jgi:hypothetical protein